MKKLIRLFTLATVLVVLSAGDILAQCAMCRSTLENGFSSGKPGIAAGINTGILYLLSMPYLLIIGLGYWWYKSSRNGSKGVSGGVA
jgi:hypothetical protein